MMNETSVAALAICGHSKVEIKSPVDSICTVTRALSEKIRVMRGFYFLHTGCGFPLVVTGGTSVIWRLAFGPPAGWVR